MNEVYQVIFHYPYEENEILGTYVDRDFADEECEKYAIEYKREQGSTAEVYVKTVHITHRKSGEE